MNFKNKLCGIYALILTTVTALTACTGDLNVTPIDPSTNTPSNTLTSIEKYDQLLAKCYSALSVSSPDGSSGDPDIDGIDGGFGQYLRAYFNCQELPTDECVMGWNDQTIKDLHGLQWTSSDVFVSAMYYRVMYEVSLCNEVIRQINNSGIEDPKMQQYKAEARCIRALAYLHAIDMFGNVPFTDETSPVGGTNPSQIKRADLFTWLETELKSLTTDDNLPANPEKYRAGKGMAYMMLAKLYLNAKVYTGTAKYAECADACKSILGLGYQLESQANYFNMFGADNDQYLGVGHEIIFSVYQDHINTQTYGGTTYIINAETGGSMDYLNLIGLGGAGWGGLRVTPEFVNLFESSDIRGKRFYTNGQNKEIKDIATFTDGYAYYKFTNKKADGSNVANINSFTDTDFPVYRLADVYLMLAECQVVGGVKVNIDGHDGIYYFNEVRKRAGANEITSPTSNDIIQERARELAWEGHRRSDLIRFGRLTSGTYLWSYKGMNSNSGEPHAVDNKYNLYPLPASEITANTNLTQNTDY
jgi:hypothetical protein